MHNPIVLITGITGFVGQNLQRYLAKEFEVVGISRNKTDASLHYENFFQEKIDYKALVHLAGKAHDLKKTANYADYYEVNYELTKRLYDQFLQSDAKKFVYISSVKAVADTVTGFLTEEVVPNPITVYGKSKLMAEEYILANLPKDKKVYILRPCMIHGPGNKGNLNLLFSLVRKGFPWPLGAFENQRSFLTVENLCFVIKELLATETIPTGVYNVADDASLSTNDLIAVIANSQQKTNRILSISPRLISGMARIGDFLHLPLNSERLQKLTESYVVSNAKIVAAIGKPLPVGVKEGLLKTMEGFSGRL
jgi:nucleoside-diphosphate-sugar epimerase